MINSNREKLYLQNFIGPKVKVSGSIIMATISFVSYIRTSLEQLEKVYRDYQISLLSEKEI